MKHFNQVFLFLALVFAHFLTSEAFRKFAIIMDEKIENCASPDEDAKVADISNFEFIAVSDYDVYINGSIKFLRNIEGKFPYHVYTEKYDRGQWHLSVYNARRDDFCASFHDPKEVWYTKMKRLKGCPLKKGDEWTWNMEPVFDFPFEFNPYVVGKWRATMKIEFYNKNKGKKEFHCIRFFGDIVEK